MNLENGWEAHSEHSTKASDVARQLSFAGLALVWMLKEYAISGRSSLQVVTTLAVICLVLGLTVDLAQYVVATLVWYRFLRRAECNGLQADDNLKVPAKMIRRIDSLWVAKILCLGCAFGLLLTAIALFSIDHV